MAAFQIEVVVRTVEVGGHYGDVIRAVLQVEALAHFQSGILAMAYGSLVYSSGEVRSTSSFMGCSASRG